MIGRGRHEDGEWVDDTHPYFLDVDRIEDLIKGLQEAVTAIKTNFTNRYYTLMYVGN